MGTVTSVEEILRTTSPAAYSAASVVADEYLRKGRNIEKTAEDILEEVGKLRNGDVGDAYSNGVHRGAEWAGYAVGAALAGAGAAGGFALGTVLGGVIGGAVGAALGAAVGGLIGAFVAGFVGDVIESVGKVVAGWLGLDFHSHGVTPGGGTWERTDHPDGSWERTEHGPSFDVTERGRRGGAFEQGIHGKGDAAGFDSNFKDDGRGNSSYGAVDKKGGVHLSSGHGGAMGFVTANAHDTDRSNGKSGLHVSWTDGKGNSSESWGYDDGSSKDSHSNRRQNADGTTTDTKTTTEKDKDGHTTSQDKTSTTTDDKGNKTTKTDHTDSHGKTTTKVESTDAHGNKNDPPNPPPRGDSSRDNPESGDDEGPRVRPGELGRGRLGHPLDHLVTPGTWRKDNGEWDGEEAPRMRDLLVAAGWALQTNWNLGHGDAAEESKKEELRRKLRGYEVTQSASGEDFIHPKARAGMLNIIAQTVLS